MHRNQNPFTAKGREGRKGKPNTTTVQHSLNQNQHQSSHRGHEGNTKERTVKKPIAESRRKAEAHRANLYGAKNNMKNLREKQ